MHTLFHYEMFDISWSSDTIQPPDVRSFVFLHYPETLTSCTANRCFQLASADPAWGLLRDFTTLRELIDTLPGNSMPSKQSAHRSKRDYIINTFWKNDLESIPATCKLADEVF